MATLKNAIKHLLKDGRNASLVYNCICLICKNLAFTYAKNDYVVTCSRKCGGIYRHTGQRKKCDAPHCRKFIYVRAYRIQQFKKLFCSKKCRQSQRITKLCTGCKKPIIRAIYYRKQGKNWFCKRKCQWMWFAKNKVGPNAPGWKGGSRIDEYGYRIVYEASKKTRKKYFYEHRLIMEKIIGRQLYPFETVHHKNGIRSDNRIQNLELWTKAQPAGQRVKDILNFVAKNYRKEILQLLNRKRK